jgi:hypothetical protein
MSQQKNKFIQFRIDELTKQKFKQHCSYVLRKPMSLVFNRCILENISKYEPKSEMEIISTTDEERFDIITNLDFAPNLKHLLSEFMKCRYEENSCLTNDCLMELYLELESNNQLHLLFEIEHFHNRVKSEWSNEK